MSDLAKLRADYKEVTGKNAFNGWNAEELQEKIDAALAGPSEQGGDEKQEKASRKTIAVQIRRDIWDSEGNRHRKGTIVDMDFEDAMDAVEAGSVSRVKG